jgi:hypothetical protein
MREGCPGVGSGPPAESSAGAGVDSAHAAADGAGAVRHRRADALAESGVVFELAVRARRRGSRRGEAAFW